MAFYPNGSPAPRVLPEYMVIVPTGAYCFDRPDEALDCARQLSTNGVRATAVRKGA